ncbi:jg14085 [Pararge aegeria aegeria]|uniref:Jg14085 protein n=1 Tax=Pararge aegeria aegeria TaxID=348720 RepID=A0A8S4RFZ9_9NEOP|nr:jg14085 [Pararge aegeria aegeria]
MLREHFSDIISKGQARTRIPMSTEPVDTDVTCESSCSYRRTTAIKGENFRLRWQIVPCQRNGEDVRRFNCAPRFVTRTSSPGNEPDRYFTVLL